MHAQIEYVNLKNFCLLHPVNRNIDYFVPQLLDEISTFFGFKLEQASEVSERKQYIKMVIDEKVDPLHYGYIVKNGDLIYALAREK